MKKYVNPVIEIKEFEVADVIQTSGGLIEGGENGDVGDIIIPKPQQEGAASLWEN